MWGVVSKGLLARLAVPTHQVGGSKDAVSCIVSGRLLCSRGQRCRVTQAWTVLGNGLHGGSAHTSILSTPSVGTSVMNQLFL